MPEQVQCQTERVIGGYTRVRCSHVASFVVNRDLDGPKLVCRYCVRKWRPVVRSLPKLYSIDKIK